MAEIVRETAWKRQGLKHADERSGADFLKNWQADFRACRTALTVAEIEVIIKDSPKDKRPGPDGVPGEVYRRHSQLVAPLFAEAWGELSAGGDEQLIWEMLGLKT